MNWCQEGNREYANCRDKWMSFFLNPPSHPPFSPHLLLSISVPIGLQARVLMNAWMHRTRWGSGWGTREWNIYPLTQKKTGVVQGEIAFLFILHTSPSHLSDQYPIFPPFLARRRRILLSILVQQLLLVDVGGEVASESTTALTRYTHGYVGHLSAVWPVEYFPPLLNWRSNTPPSMTLHFN